VSPPSVATVPGLAHSPWPARAVCLAAGLVLTPAVGTALSDASRAVQVVAGGGAWALWLVALVATLVPSTVSLTVLRVAGPAAGALGLAALVAAGPSVATVAGLVAGLVAAVVALLPETAETFADGSSYGDERRYPLRAPAALLAGPAELAVVVVAAGVAAGPLLLAARQWLAGVVALAVGWPAAWLAARALHGLSRRWLVFVPGGVVVHDPLTLAEPILLPRATVRSFGPAPAGTDATDLTSGAWGLAVEARLVAPISLGRRVPRQAAVELDDVTAVLVTPSRPGRAVAEARRRRIG